MRRPGWVRGRRITFALLMFTAVSGQIMFLVGQGFFKPTNFFSFFTIEGNLFAATVLLVLGLRARPEEKLSLTEDMVRGRPWFTRRRSASCTASC